MLRLKCHFVFYAWYTSPDGHRAIQHSLPETASNPIPNNREATTLFCYRGRGIIGNQQKS